MSTFKHFDKNTLIRHCNYYFNTVVSLRQSNKTLDDKITFYQNMLNTLSELYPNIYNEIYQKYKTEIDLYSQLK